jgi:hypothetical protein
MPKIHDCGAEAVTAEQRPVRLHLSRAKGFNLQAHSRATNGLPAVNVARPSGWGNPARIGAYFKVGDPDPSGRSFFRMAWCETTEEYATPAFTFVANQEIAVNLFRKLADTGFYSASKVAELRGKNLACFCPFDRACHADVLLELANK